MTARVVPLRRISGDVTELTDEALLAACATGDRAALGALFDRFHVAVYKFIARLHTVNEASRDDIVQATFLELPRVAHKFRGESAVRTWILGVSSNVARHYCRGEERRRARHERYARGPTGVVVHPDVELDRRRRLLAIIDVLSTLPYDQQVAFVMSDLEHIPGVEIARVLEVPEGTIWRRVHVARKALREALAKDRT